MKTETKVFLFLTVHSIIMVLAIVLSAYWLLSSAPLATSTLSLLTKFKYVIAIVALLLGVVYFVVGYKKNAYMFYKAYMLLYRLYLALSILAAMSYESIDAIPAIATIIAFSFATILATGKDLGKGKSYTLALSLVICSLVYFVYTWLDKGFIDMELVYMNISGIMLAINTLLMVMGKYYDKKMRGAE